MVGFDNTNPTLFVGGSNDEDSFGRTGIGTKNPFARLHVWRDALPEDAGTHAATYIEMDGAEGSTTLNMGLRVALLTPYNATTTNSNRGVSVYSLGTRYNYGGYFEGEVTSESIDNHGVFGYAHGASAPAQSHYGVKGQGSGGASA